MEWTWRRWEELSVDELYRLMVLRQAVFVMEQNCVYQDADGLDHRCEHLLGTHEGELAACARIIPPGVKSAEPAIGRVVTSQSVRRMGFGRELMRVAIGRCEALFPGSAVRVEAQKYLEPFYGSFGFVTSSEPYWEDGIIHVTMIRGGGNGPAGG